MKILHIIDLKQPNLNGVANAVKDYVKYEMKYCDVAIYYLEENIELENATMYNFEIYKSLKELPNGFDKPDIVIFNEVYKPKYIRIYKECIKRGIPYIIIPHGCLTKKAQSSKRIKKKIGNIMLFNKFIKKANAIQFLNQNEKNNTKLKNIKYIISGNGTDVFAKRINKKPKNKNLVYVGRYAINCKGLDLMVDVCKKYKQWFIDNNIRIDLYGTSTGKDLKILKKMINNNHIQNILVTNDAIYKEEKKKILENAYGFIQTSRYEAQPMAIIEAMGYGIPCIVTYGTSFGNIMNDNKCGIGIEFDIEQTFNAIKKICENSIQRNIFAENALLYSKRVFNWENIIKDLLLKYKKIITKE